MSQLDRKYLGRVNPIGPGDGTDMTDAYRSPLPTLDAFSKAKSRETCRSSRGTKFELVFNPKMGKTLGLTVRLTLETAADKVIE
jgi:hypothetical protein